MYIYICISPPAVGDILRAYSLFSRLCTVGPSRSFPGISISESPHVAVLSRPEARKAAYWNVVWPGVQALDQTLSCASVPVFLWILIFELHLMMCETLTNSRIPVLDFRSSMRLLSISAECCTTIALVRICFKKVLLTRNSAQVRNKLTSLPPPPPPPPPPHPSKSVASMVKLWTKTQIAPNPRNNTKQQLHTLSRHRCHQSHHH